MGKRRDGKRWFINHELKWVCLTAHIRITLPEALRDPPGGWRESDGLEPIWLLVDGYTFVHHNP